MQSFNGVKIKSVSYHDVIVKSVKWFYEAELDSRKKIALIKRQIMIQKMDNKLFKDIGEVPNARESWNFISDAVTSDLIGDDIFSLPHIEDGSRYRLGDIIVKEEKSPKKRRLHKKTPKAVRTGHLTGFLETNVSKGDNQAVSYTFHDRYAYRNADMNPNYIWVTETTRKGVRKSIRVEVVGCQEIYMTHIPDENSLFHSLNKGFLDFFTKINLISTLYRAQKIRIQVTINDKTDQYTTTSPDWTIGFKLHGYNFDSMKAPSEKSPKKMKVKIMPLFLFPGFTMGRRQPPSPTPGGHDQESKMRERAHKGRSNVRAQGTHN